MAIAGTPYPYYRMQINGPSESGFSLAVQVEQGAGGPLEGLSEADLIAAIRNIFDSREGVSTTLTRYSVSTDTL
ncbi:hypothetical protein ACF082_29730 [Streptomyces lydicus]|uniref:hypothetical protein n=1 Tax=Streptomyces lydicus TaxID=47763 RepID=UPI0036FCDE65